MKRVLITGVTGYIGSNLAQVLLPDCKVYGLVWQPVNMEYIADMRDKLHLLPFDGSYESMEAALGEAQPDLVYHLAASYTGGHGALEVPKLVASNITLGAYLLEAMVSFGVSKLVSVSTVMAHYEGAVYHPLNLYAATKRAFSDLLTYYTDAGLLQAVTLVLSDTYGPGDHRPKVLNLIKDAVRSGKVLELSDGGQDYDVVYIDDVIQAFCQAGTWVGNGSYPGGTFQVAAEHPLTLRETAEQMLQINGQTAKLLWNRRPTLKREIRKAVRIFPNLPGWKPEISLDEGLRRFWQEDTMRKTESFAQKRT